MKLDKIDYAIIMRLQENARLSNQALADAVGLTPAPCLRRVRRLEEAGVIAGYSAQIDPATLGHGFTVLVSVDLKSNESALVDRFQKQLCALEAVQEAWKMFGTPDYLLRVNTTDVVAYERFLSEQLLTLPGVERAKSHFPMKKLKG